MKDSKGNTISKVYKLNEAKRTYSFLSRSGLARVYTITEPVRLQRKGRWHHVQDVNGKIHIVPRPGQLRCVIRKFPKPKLVEKTATFTYYEEVTPLMGD